jgi:hypothetical protein
MRRTAGMTWAALLCAAAVAAPAAAVAGPAAGGVTPVTPKMGAVPAFASLPEGHVAPLPRAAPPAHIAATERVDGFFPSKMRPDMARAMSARPGVSFTYLFAQEKQAKAFMASRSGSGNECPVDTCLTDGGDGATLSRAAADDADADAEPGDWPASCSSMLSFQVDLGQDASAGAAAKRPDAAAQNVHAVRSQQLVMGEDGHASLSVTDVWLDARTRGARLIGRSTLPLSRVFVGPNGLEVYGARDGNAVHVLMHAGDHPADDPALSELLRARLRALAVTLPDGSGGSGDCGHVGFTLRAAPGEGQMVTLRSAAFLPSLDADHGGPDGESDDARAERWVEAMRQRPFQLSVSATSSTADATPVLSIALGWTGREHIGG